METTVTSSWDEILHEILVRHRPTPGLNPWSAEARRGAQIRQEIDEAKEKWEATTSRDDVN